VLHLDRRQPCVHNHSPGPARRPVSPGTLRGMRARLVPVFLALCVSLGACSDGGEEPDAAPTLPPITEARSPSPEPDAVPPQATEATPEGAAEFARLFYSEIARGFQTADPALVSRLSADDCRTCSEYIASITAVQEQGWRAKGGDFEILFAVAPAVEGDTAKVDVGWNFSPVQYIDGSGSVVDDGPPVTGVEEQLKLRRDGDSWIVTAVDRIRQRS
jgi:hypothetical protein